MHPNYSTTRRALLGAGAAAMLGPAAHAQIDDSIRGRPSEANHFIATPRGWDHPMTPWGEPDIRATLDMMQASRIPLERCGNSNRYGAPPCDMDKAWLTEEEYEAQMEAYRNRVDRSTELAEQGEVGAAIQAGQTDPNIPQRQTNLIVDPPDGLLPELTAQAKERALTMKSDWSLPGEDLYFDTHDDFDSWDRCITRGMPSMMMPYRYNGGFKIHQAPGYVVFNIEMIHEARVIPIGDVEPLDPDIRQYLGESRGRWEGTTLVVETTNYRVDPWINQPLINLAVVGSPPGNRFPVSDRLKTTERITRLNDDVWLYEITTEDPEVLTEPFTVRYPMRNDPDYLMPEYACHEDNYIVQGYVETSRYERENPTPFPAHDPVDVGPELARELNGRWVGRPDIATIDVDIEIEFVNRGDGTITGRLIGTNLNEEPLNRPLQGFSVNDGVMSFTFPNVSQNWTFGGEITDAGIVGFVSSIQGGAPVTFRPVMD